MGTGCSRSSLKEHDYFLLEEKFGKTREEIDRIFVHFKEQCTSGRLNKRQFEELMSMLWSESIKTDGVILDTVYEAFDQNSSGYVTLEEFLGTCAEKVIFERTTIEAVFNKYYDKDRRGVIKLDKMQRLIGEICKSYSEADEELTGEDIEYISQEFIDNLLEYSKNSFEITREAFVQAVMNNTLLAAFMIPPCD